MIDDMTVCIEHLGECEECETRRGWFALPLDYEEIKECIGLDCTNEEYMISETGGIPFSIPDYCTIDQLNQIYELISELPEQIVDNLDDFITYYGNLEGVVEHKEDIYFYPNCETMEDVARYYAEELQTLGEIPPSLQDYIDYEAYGRDLEIGGYFIATEYGMCEIQR